MLCERISLYHPFDTPLIPSETPLIQEGIKLDIFMFKAVHLDERASLYGVVIMLSR